MKKILFLSVVILFSITGLLSAAQTPSVTGPVTVAVPATVTAPGASAVPGPEQAGVVAAIGGKVEIKTAGQTTRVAVSGQPVFTRDEVKTDAQGHLQILLLDRTVFTIGPNSSITIDEFVYDPKTQKGKIQASVTKGVFRYVSGKIAAKQSDHVSVRLPTATIGFRGTVVGGQVMPDNSSLAALLGPGDNNDAGERSGSFVMNGTGGGSGGQQLVNRTGFGVQAGANGGLSGVFQLSDTQLNGLTAGLSPSGGGGGGGGSGGQGGSGGDGGGGGQPGGGGSVGDMSGETGAIAGANSGFIAGLNLLGDNNNDTTTTLAQGGRDDQNAGSVPDGITQMEELGRITAGKSFFYGTGSFLYNNGTAPTVYSMAAQCEIDFGSKTIGGTDSWVKITDSKGGVFDQTAGSGAAEPRSFAGTGPAAFRWTNVEGSSGGTFTRIDLVLLNGGGVIAKQGAVAVDYVGADGETTGTGVAVGSRTDTSASSSGGGSVTPA